MPVKDFWTITLVIMVSISATYIGYRNFDWVLKTVGQSSR
jgi:hypothetical protein